MNLKHQITSILPNHHCDFTIDSGGAVGTCCLPGGSLFGTVRATNWSCRDLPPRLPTQMSPNHRNLGRRSCAHCRNFAGSDFGYRNIHGRLAEGSRTAVGGAILAAMNTASEYGFGAVIAALPGFLVLSKALAAIPDPLLNEAISITTLCRNYRFSVRRDEYCSCGYVRHFIAAAHAANIPLEVFTAWHLWPVAAWDTLPHNGAVITLLAITGLSHRQAYGGIFAITIIKSLAVLFYHRRVLHHRHCLRKIIMNLKGKTALVTGPPAVSDFRYCSDTGKRWRASDPQRLR